MWMWLIAAINRVARHRRGVVAGVGNAAAAVLNTTSCSLMRAGVEACRVPLTGEEAGPTAGAAGLDSRCNMSGCLPMIGGSCGGVTAWNTVSSRKAPPCARYLIYTDEIRLAFLGDSRRS